MRSTDLTSLCSCLHVTEDELVWVASILPSHTNFSTAILHLEADVRRQTATAAVTALTKLASSNMADSMTFKELRSLPPVHLELAIEHLENSEKKPGITTDAKASLANTILAVKSFLEVRRLRVMMLQTNAGSTESLSRMYYQMSKEELMVRLRQ